MQSVSVATKRERWSGGAGLGRHRHTHAYVAVVLDGAYEETGDRGRLDLSPGAVAFHGPFEAHRNRFGSRGAQILNLRVSGCPRWPCALGQASDPDAVVKAAEKNPREALETLIAMTTPSPGRSSHWVDDLTAALNDDPQMSLGAWARANDLAPETLSRVFGTIFGLSPRRYRSDVRTRRALADIITSDAPLVSIAFTAGFADQAHMTRAIRQLTGATPGAWRRPGGGENFLSLLI